MNAKRNETAEVRHEFFREIMDVARHELLQLGITADVADHAAHAVADRVADEFSGLPVYVPQEHAIKLSRRERQIVARRAAGASVAELAREYGMAEGSIYRLLRRATSRGVIDAQQDLFPGEKPPTAQNAQEAP